CRRPPETKKPGACAPGFFQIDLGRLERALEADVGFPDVGVASRTVTVRVAHRRHDLETGNRRQVEATEDLPGVSIARIGAVEPLGTDLDTDLLVDGNNSV